MSQADFQAALRLVQAGHVPAAISKLALYIGTPSGAEHYDAHRLQAMLLHAQGAWGDAAAAYQKILLRWPEALDFSSIALNLADILVALKQPAAAMEIYRLLIARDPNARAAHSGMIEVLRKSGQRLDACAYAEQRAAQDPCAQTLNDYARLLMLCDDLTQSEAQFQKACALAPQDWRIKANYASLRAEIQDMASALAFYAEAQKLMQADTEAAPHEVAGLVRDWGITLLQAGVYASGWEKYEARLHTLAGGNVPAAVPRPLPLWDGAPTAHVLLYCEQGHGDTLQFLRYVPDVLARVKKLSICVQPALLPVLQRLAWPVEWHASTGRALAADARLPLMSLPHVLKLPQPNARPGDYLKDVLPAAESVKHNIGLVWAGSRTHENDHRRSLPFSRVEELCSRLECNFLTLQLEPPPVNAPANLHMPDAPLRDFSDAAHLMHQCRIVVSVDTAAAHLAGALGVPCLLLLPYTPDWRWGLKDGEGDWYPSIRPIRQPRPGDWGAVIDKTANMLASP